MSIEIFDSPIHAESQEMSQTKRYVAEEGLRGVKQGPYA